MSKALDCMKGKQLNNKLTQRWKPEPTKGLPTNRTLLRVIQLHSFQVVQTDIYISVYESSYKVTAMYINSSSINEKIRDKQVREKSVVGIS